MKSCLPMTCGLLSVNRPSRPVVTSTCTLVSMEDPTTGDSGVSLSHANETCLRQTPGPVVRASIESGCIVEVGCNFGYVSAIWGSSREPYALTITKRCPVYVACVIEPTHRYAYTGRGTGSMNLDTSPIKCALSVMVRSRSQFYAHRLGYADFPDPTDQSVENIARMRETIALIQRKWLLTGSCRNGVLCRATLSEADKRIQILASQNYRNKTL